jgi:hypothetical protein
LDKAYSVLEHQTGDKEDETREFAGDIYCKIQQFMKQAGAEC